MSTVSQPQPHVNQPQAIQFRHGEDLAILDTDRSVCRNDTQRAGYDSMAARVAAHDHAAEAGWPYSDPEYLAEWSCELQQRYEAAQRRRALAQAMEAQTDLILAEIDSPFYSGHVHEDLVELLEVA